MRALDRQHDLRVLRVPQLVEAPIRTKLVKRGVQVLAFLALLVNELARGVENLVLYRILGPRALLDHGGRSLRSRIRLVGSCSKLSYLATLRAYVEACARDRFLLD